ncbi:MAG TPA: alpha/beta hydrolase [Tepidisphaeraceae bacterium]|jgi:alpha-L-fucosidase 2
MPEEIEYGAEGGEKQLLDVYRPAGGRPGPVAVVVHGGGWGSGDKRADVPFIDALVAAGVVVFSINYRLAPKHPWPACLDDVHAAVTWARRHAGQYGGDPARLALIGYSAGGHLACQDAITREAPGDVAAVVALAAPTDMVLDNFRRLGVSPALRAVLGRTEVDDDTLEVLWQMSPINHLRPGLCPFLLVHGTTDTSVPYSQSTHLQKRLRDLGVAAELITLEKAGHRISDWPQFDPRYAERIAEWVISTLRA